MVCEDVRLFEDHGMDLENFNQILAQPSVVGQHTTNPVSVLGMGLTKAVGHRGMTWMLQRHDTRYDLTTLKMQDPGLIRDQLCFISRRY